MDANGLQRAHQFLISALRAAFFGPSESLALAALVAAAPTAQHGVRQPPPGPLAAMLLDPLWDHLPQAANLLRDRLPNAHTHCRRPSIPRWHSLQHAKPPLVSSLPSMQESEHLQPRRRAKGLVLPRNPMRPTAARQLFAVSEGLGTYARNCARPWVWSASLRELWVPLRPPGAPCPLWSSHSHSPSHQLWQSRCNAPPCGIQRPQPR
mmetsp:Transcript_73234/g.161691  ORF Transcript_73234/g.161691 Transcript_73234/m.161691 type:complete len:208 (-) Transcript_73234:817-1440(-)